MDDIDKIAEEEFIAMVKEEFKAMVKVNQAEEYIRKQQGDKKKNVFSRAEMESAFKHLESLEKSATK